MCKVIAEDQVTHRRPERDRRRANRRDATVEVVRLRSRSGLVPGHHRARSGRDRGQLVGRSLRGRPDPHAAGRRVGPVRVHHPTGRRLEVVEERAAQRLCLADRRVQAAGTADDLEDGFAVAVRLASDDLVGRVEAVDRRVDRLRWVHLERVHEDPVHAVRPVDLVAVGDVQRARLLRRIAVRRGHALADRDKRCVVVLRHVAGHVAGRVAVRPEDLLAGGVERDRGLDLLASADHPAIDEVADGARFRGREGLRAAIRVGRLRARRAAAAGPAVAVVAVEVGADVARARSSAGGSCANAIRRTGEVIFPAVGIDHEDDPDLARVDELGDLGVRAVAVAQPAQDRKGLLDREVLARVVQPIEQHLGLVLVGRHVVGHLRRPDGAVLVALPDRRNVDDGRVVGLGLLNLGHHLRVRVVAAVLRREVGRGSRRWCCEGQQGQAEDGQERGSAVHGRSLPR